MLLKIREKAQGTFAWVILVIICVPFALWGLQNYNSGSSEKTIAEVGDREFFQQDLNQAYAQYSQKLAGTNFDEKKVKKQALEQLIRDELLWQYVAKTELVVNDKTARDFIKNLEYFQSDGQFDVQRYKAMLAGQGTSQNDFIAKIKKALLMQAFQRSIVNSAFATPQDIDNFFKIENQTRDVEVIEIALQTLTEPLTPAEITTYYQKNQQQYVSDEQVSIAYVQLSLDDLAKDIKPTETQLTAHYEANKDLYTTQGRRKISHILFAFNEDTGDDKQQLAKALSAKQALQHKSFATLAQELSDDKATATKGGDLGLFNAGVMEEAFEDVVNSLQLDEVSQPVKSAFGYHLIKLTQLLPHKIQTFAEAKDALTTAYQRQEAESTFYELGEALPQVSYENPSDLTAVADLLGVPIKKTDFFSKKNNNQDNTETQDAITDNNKVIAAAFSEDVLQGNNSEPIEIASDKLLVLRALEHKPATVKTLQEVRPHIVTTLSHIKSQSATLTHMQALKKAVTNGQSMQAVAQDNNLEVRHFPALTRTNSELSQQTNQAIFKATKPTASKTTLLYATEPSGAYNLIKLLAVTEGVMSESNKAQQLLAEHNIAKAFGQAEFKAILDSVRSNTRISINTPE